METLIISGDCGKQALMKAISGMVKKTIYKIDRELVGQILFELILSARKKSEEVKVWIDDETDHLFFGTEYAGSVFEPNIKNTKGKSKGELLAMGILQSNDSESYGLYDIISDVASVSGKVRIISDGELIEFSGKEHYYTCKHKCNGSASIGIYFGKGIDETDDIKINKEGTR